MADAQRVGTGGNRPRPCPTAAPSVGLHAAVGQSAAEVRGRTTASM